MEIEVKTETTREDAPQKPDDFVGLPPDHPLASVFGKHRNDKEYLDRMMEGVSIYRKRVAREEARLARQKK